MVTDKEEFLALLTKWGVGYDDKAHPTMVTLEVGMEKVNGGECAAVEITFSKDGSFRDMWIGG